MNTRQRLTEPRTNPATAGGGDPGDSDLGTLREQAAGLQAAADRAIGRALESDTARYLSNHMQRGGQ